MTCTATLFLSTVLGWGTMIHCSNWMAVQCWMMGDRQCEVSGQQNLDGHNILLVETLVQTIGHYYSVKKKKKIKNTTLKLQAIIKSSNEAELCRKDSASWIKCLSNAWICISCLWLEVVWWFVVDKVFWISCKCNRVDLIGIFTRNSWWGSSVLCV